MKKTRNKILAALIALLFVFSPMSFVGIFIFSQAADTAENITGYQEWNQNITIDHSITIASGATLVINKGVEVSFTQKWTNFEVEGTLIIRGTSEQPVTIKTDLVKDAFAIITKKDSKTLIDNTDIVNGGYSAFQVRNFTNTALASGYKAALDIGGGSVDVRNTTFDNCSNAVIVSSENTTNVHINFSRFLGDGFYVDAPSGADFRYDWWGLPDGPAKNCGLYDGEDYCSYEKIFGDFDFSQWMTDENFQMGASNVLFLPGIEASKLYKNGAVGTEDQLWLPNYFGNDLADLALDEDGKSVNSVYTRDVLADIKFLWTDGSVVNIYRSFLDNLKELKDKKTINDYEEFAYDWRQGAEDIAQNGTPYEGGVTKNIVAEISRLAASSKSGKVTIVAHSMGGLVAKAAMIELEKQGMANEVDNVIMVSSPQMGTPEAILSMLYGYNNAILGGTLVSQEDARTLSENMPSVYGLLPSEKYFERTQDSFINFRSDNTRYAEYKKAYGDSIDSYSEFKDFLLAKVDKRDKPAKSDVDKENVLNEKLLEESSVLHQRLDAWVPPFNVNVVQIAGWGLDTVSGVDYKEKDAMQCFVAPGSKIPSCTGTGEYEPFYEPKFTVDGDGVVVAPSELMLPEMQNVKKYWVNLDSYDDWLTIGRRHGDILEVDSVRQLILNSIEDNKESLPEFITTFRPNDYEGVRPRIRMSLYSPLDIHLYDEAGNHTGPKEVTDENGGKHTIFEENISSSYYEVFGDRKYVGFPSGEKIRIEMDGYALGSYTVKMAEVVQTEKGERNAVEASFENLATTEKAVVKLDVPESGLADVSPIKADMDNDGASDYEVDPVIVIPLSDENPPETKIALIGQEGEGGWHMGDVTATLAAVDGEDGSGISSTEYSLDGENWSKYAEPIIVSQEGVTDFSYRSSDQVGNVEIAKSMQIKIDKTAPEAKMQFNEKTQKLDIIGTDNLSQDVSVTLATQPIIKKSNKKEKSINDWFVSWRNQDREKNLQNWVATITDESGHTTNLIFKRLKEKDGKIFLSLRSIAYDGTEGALGRTTLQYKWQINKTNQYAQFATHFHSENMMLESHYMPKKNQTWLMEKPMELADNASDDNSESRPVKTKLPGMIITSIVTEKGKVSVNY